jgi:hypothetical protein
MKRLFTAFVLLSAFCLPQSVFACGYECMEVTPGCGRCVYTGDPSTGCRNRAGSCGCLDEIGCLAPSLDPLQQAAIDNLGFIPADLEPADAGCANAAPALAVVAE